MSRTFISQGAQIFNSELYSDTLVPGSALSSSAGTLEGDLNALRTLVKLHLLGSTGSVGNWYDDLSVPVSGSVFGQITGSKRGLNSLNQGLYNAENKNLLYRVEVLPFISVSASNNWVVLAATGETPSQTIAFNDTVNGAIVAKLTGTFNSHNLDKSIGANAISPKNLVIIVTSSNGNTIPSPTHNNRDIYGLLQVSGSATEGAAFNNTTNAVQISFVTINSAGNGLEAVPASEIAGKQLQYAYVARSTYTGVPEDSFLTTNFTDFSSLVDMTLATAVANQQGPFTQSNDIDWAIANNRHLAFLSGGLAMLRFDVALASTTATMNVTNFNVNNTNAAQFKAGASFTTGSTFINVGVTANQIDGAGALTIKAVNDLLLSGAQVTFADAFNAGSTYTGALPLATSSGDWTSFKTEFGNVSILAAFDKLYNSIASVSSSVATGGSGRRVGYGVAVVTASLLAGVNLSTAAGHKNLSGSLPSLVGVNFDTNAKVYINGVRVYNGSTNDVVPGSGLSDGDLVFADKLKGGTVIQVDVFNN